jgi:hypothetical protein
MEVFEVQAVGVVAMKLKAGWASKIAGSMLEREVLKQLEFWYPKAVQRQECKARSDAFEGRGHNHHRPASPPVHSQRRTGVVDQA